MLLWGGVLIICGLLGLRDQADAGELRPIHRLPFALALMKDQFVFTSDSIAVGDTLKLAVQVATLGGPTAASVHVGLPTGWTLVGGDTAAVIRLRSIQPLGERLVKFAVVPKTVQLDPIVVHVIYSYGNSNVSDEAKLYLPTRRGNLGIVLGPVVRPSALRREDGALYRYTRAILLPLEEEEWVLEGEMEALGGRAQAIRKEAAICASCDETVKSVELLVAIGRDGNVKAVLPARPDYLSEKPVNFEAGVDALRKWRFRPAVFRGTPVADWLRVSVPIVARDESD